MKTLEKELWIKRVYLQRDVFLLTQSPCPKIEKQKCYVERKGPAEPSFKGSVVQGGRTVARQVVHLLLINALSSTLYSSYPDFFPTQIILWFLVGQRKVVVNPIIAEKKKIPPKFNTWRCFTKKNFPWLICVWPRNYFYSGGAIAGYRHIIIVYFWVSK